MAIGDRIRMLRDAKGWTQNHLAVVAGVPQPTVWRLEKGLIHNPKMALLTKLAHALEVSMDVLTGVPQKSFGERGMLEDGLVETVFRSCERLSNAHRRQLLNFMKFLEQEEAAEKEREQP